MHAFIKITKSLVESIEFNTDRQTIYHFTLARTYYSCNYTVTSGHKGYFPFSDHNTQNMPLAVPYDDFGRCGRSENVTNEVTSSSQQLICKD